MIAFVLTSAADRRSNKRKPAELSRAKQAPRTDVVSSDSALVIGQQPV